MRRSGTTELDYGPLVAELQRALREVRVGLGDDGRGVPVVSALVRTARAATGGLTLQGGDSSTVRRVGGDGARRGAWATHWRTVSSMLSKAAAFDEYSPVESSQVCSPSPRATVHFTFLPDISDMASVKSFMPQS